MRIVIDTRTVNRGGVHRYAWSLLPHLVHRLHEAGFVCIVAEATSEGNSSLHLPARFVELDGRHGFARGPDEGLQRVLDQEGADAYFSFDYLIDFTIETPFVFTVHDATRFLHPNLAYSDQEFVRRYGDEDLEWLRLGGRTAAVSFVDALHSLTDQLLRRASGVITVSNTSLHNLRGVFPDSFGPSQIVRCGVDPIRLRHDSVPGTERKDPALPYLLHVGQVQPHKRVDWWLRGILQKAQSVGAFEIQFVGGFAEKDRQVLALVHELDHYSRVRFIGRVSDERLRRMMEGASACISGSLSEGYGLPLIESLAVGTEVIAPRVPIFEEVLGPHGHLFQPNSIDGFLELTGKAVSGNLERRSWGFLSPVWEEEAALLARFLIRRFTGMYDS